MSKSFYPLFHFSFVLIIYFLLIGCSTNESSSSSEEAVEEKSIEKKKDDSSSEKDTLKNQKVESDSILVQNEDDVLSFYTNLMKQMHSDQKYELKKKGTMNFPSSLAEDLEGGAIIPRVIEISNAAGLVGLVMYKEKSPYPLTFALALPVNDDGFELPVVHYEIIDINHTPVLRVIGSISGLLTEGPFQQAFYNMRGQGKGVVPMHVSNGETMTKDDRKAIAERIVQSKLPAGSYNQDCPPGLNEGRAKNVQLEFQRTGILAKTEYTGFSTDFFYYFTSDSTMTCWPLEKYMISPDDERIEEEVSKKQQNVSWKMVKNPDASGISLMSSSSMLPSSYYCRIP